MITFTIEASDLVKAEIELLKAREELSHAEKPLKRIKDYQTKRWLENFDGNGQIYGSWPALAESTMTDREKKGYGGGHMLVRSGGLLASFIAQNQDGKIEQSAIDWVMRNQVPAWPLTHHSGFGPSGGFTSTVPARVLWDINSDDENEHQEIYEAWIGELLAAWL